MDSKSSIGFPMEQPAIPRGGGGGGAEDFISGLPDELLHIILVRLPSAAAAARTSVLSRRWRGVWAHMPELAICVSPAPATPPSALLDSVDAALNSYAAPTLHSLKIDVSGVDWCDVPARRIAPWLRFASQRLAGKLRLRHNLEDALRVRGIKEELALPICERATEISIRLQADFFLRPPPTGSFSALTDLMISCHQMDGGELGRVVSSAQSPNLRKLHIYVSKLGPVCDVSICSESLECLDYSAINTGKLEVNAPMLQQIDVSHVVVACIAAPKLEMVRWSGKYNPGLHQFAVSGRQRHLQSLHIMHSTFLGMLISSTRLMERYDSAKELIVSLGLYKEIAGYLTFLQEMDKLPICESLIVNFMANHHALPAMVFHLLRRCSCIRKLNLLLDQSDPPKVTSCSVPGCPCLLPENYSLDGITFHSLEEIGIKFFTGSVEQEEFMKLLLSKCNMGTLKRVDITVPLAPASSEIMEVVERVRCVCHPKSKIQFNVHAKCAILKARSNLTRTPSHWPPNIEDAHAIALQLYENIAISLRD